MDAERMKEAKTEVHNDTRISEKEGVPVLAAVVKKGLKLPFFLSKI